MENNWYKKFNYATITLVFILAILLMIDTVRGTY